MRTPTRIWLAVLLLFSFHAWAKDYTAPGVTLTAGDPAGMRFKALSDLEVGDSLSVELTGARPGSSVEMLLQDDRGREWSYSLVHGDRRGNVPRTLFWYQSGVIGTTARRVDFRPDPSFTTFDEAERFFADNMLHLTVRERDGRLLAIRDFRPRPRNSPFVFPSNKAGVLENSINARNESLYVTGRNFPAGATVQLFLVPNRFGWAAGDTFGATVAKTLTLGAAETSFTAEVLPSGTQLPGTYDIIARVGSLGSQTVQPSDVISFGEDTGVVLYYIIINGNIVVESAGRMKASPAYFEFSNFFDKGEDVYGAVDPTDVPANHTGGSYAAHWTVAHQPAAYWDGANPPLNDVSGDGPEIHRVKYFCINGTRIRIWAAATQAAPIAPYDVVVDFGAVPANDAASFVADNTYNKGLDFIDGYSDVGFWVGEAPDATGPNAVGTVEYLDQNGISGITDPNGVTGPTYPINVGWARIMYPATMAGTGTPVAPGGPYPVAVFLHGRHWNCDFDGSGPGLAGGYSTCPQNQRIPSHEGYNYIMQQLASQGIFCISINAYDIQFDNGAWNYDVRGRLVLKFLDKLRDWTTNGTDPFGGLFNGKLDMSKIALSGHSRGGEGVVAADQLNATWPNPHSIVAVNAIAPTDQNVGGDYNPSVPYYLLVGARDGDVSNMQGFRTYDHAYPQGMLNRKAKAVGWVYGANHNYFNTIWTPTADLGMANPWAGSIDDCGLGPVANQPQRCQLRMSAAAQRQIALSTITAFFRLHLQNATGYREILTGVLEPAAMDNANVFWTFQDGLRNAIDNFEQQPLDATTNTAFGLVTAPGSTIFEERLLNSDSSSYPFGPATDPAFKHDTLGLKLAWAGPMMYETNIPAGPARDVSMYTHLTLRVAKKDSTLPMAAGPDVVFHVNLEDSQGHTGMYWADVSNYQSIPHPFLGSKLANLAQMSGIRIPLQNFTKNNSQVDLTDIVKIKILTEGSAEIGLDDIEFGK
jgi:hypothetical protein